MSYALDHLAIACTDLDAAREWLEFALGAPMQPRGVHAAMGTHNHLISLGPDFYLELIAVDPDAPKPAHARWFDLDNFEGMAKPASWIVRCPDMGAALDHCPQGTGLSMVLDRGAYHWAITVPADGKLPYDGLFPAMIEWASAPPAPALPDHQLRLKSIFLSHPRAEALKAALAPFGDLGVPIHVARGANPSLGFEIDTPRGRRAF